MYEIIDDFLDNENFNEIKSMFYTNLPWYIGNVIDDEKYFLSDTIHNIQFVHTFYEYYSPISPFITQISPIIDKICPKALIRVKSNLTLRTESVIEHAFHVDNKGYDSKTSVFYINDNDGYTVFENGERVYSKQNRLVTFDSKIFHSGTTTTDSQFRIVLNLNYFK